MWKGRQLKENSLTVLKSNYSRIIAVCFLTAMLTTSYSVSTSLLNQYVPDTHLFTAETTTSAPELSNSEVITNAVDQIASQESSPSKFGVVTQVLIDLYTSGKSIFFSILRFFNNLFTRRSYLSSLFLSAGVLAAVLYQFFVANIILIGEKRFFLEVRNYPQTRISKIFFLYKLRYIYQPGKTMFLRNIFQWLWNLTIVGGIIKYYEYSMIPFILAENPSIASKDAFLLSKQLMHGNKGRLFLLHFSFLGWSILSILTLGLFDFLFVNPYRTGTDAELYMAIRKNHILTRGQQHKLLNDALLDQVPSEDELLISKALYDDSEGVYVKISYFAPEQYPGFLFSLQPPASAVQAPFDIKQTYHPLSCVFLFFAFSVFGWLFENAAQIIRYGTMSGHDYFLLPWLPLYGLGGLYILLVLKRFAHNPILTFCLMFLSFSVLEFTTGALLECGIDFPGINTDYFLNPAGKTALGGILFFSLVGAAFLYYFSPRWDAAFSKLRKGTRIVICVLLCLLFAWDLFYGKQYSALFSTLPGNR